MGGLTWTPDGRQLLYPSPEPGDAPKRWTIRAVDAAGGSPSSALVEGVQSVDPWQPPLSSCPAWPRSALLFLRAHSPPGALRYLGRAKVPDGRPLGQSTGWSADAARLSPPPSEAGVRGIAAVHSVLPGRGSRAGGPAGHVCGQLGSRRQAWPRPDRPRGTDCARDRGCSRHRRGRRDDHGSPRGPGRDRGQATDGPGRCRRHRGRRRPSPVHPLRPERGRRGDGDDPRGDDRLRSDRHPRQQRPARHGGPDPEPRPGGLGGDLRHQRARLLPDDQAPAPGHARAPEGRDREHGRVRGWRPGRRLCRNQDGAPLAGVHRRP